jgi:hypothetical protein
MRLPGADCIDDAAYTDSDELGLLEVDVVAAVRIRDVPGAPTNNHIFLPTIVIGGQRGCQPGCRKDYCNTWQ